MTVVENKPEYKPRPPKMIDSIEWVSGYLLITWKDWYWNGKDEWLPDVYKRIYVEVSANQ